MIKGHERETEIREERQVPFTKGYLDFFAQRPVEGSSGTRHSSRKRVQLYP